MLNNPFHQLMIIEPEQQNTPKYPAGDQPAREPARTGPLQRTSGMPISPEDDVIFSSSPPRNRQSNVVVKQKNNVAEKHPRDTEEGII